MTGTSHAWLVWALLSAVFAALTAVLAKVGVADVGSDYATLIRTAVVLLALTLIVTATRQWQSLAGIPARSLTFLTLSGLATGASWLCYFRALKLGDVSRVAPVDKLSVVLVAVFGALFLSERLSWTNWAGVLLIGAGVLLLSLRA